MPDESELLKIDLLGPPHVTFNGQPVTIKRKQTRAVLYFLACQKDPVSRGQLITTFWPNLPEEQARKTLREILSSLRTQFSGVEVIMPLWGRDRNELLVKLIANKFAPVFSCVKQPWLTADWLAKELNQPVLKQLHEINLLNGMDLCGERGEYHTLVVDGPLFRERLSIEVSTKRAKDTMFYLDIEKVSLIAKKP